MVRGKYLTRVFLIIFSLIAILQPFDAYAYDIGYFKNLRFVATFKTDSSAWTSYRGAYTPPNISTQYWEPSFVFSSPMTMENGDNIAFTLSTFSRTTLPPNCLTHLGNFRVLQCDRRFQYVNVPETLSDLYLEFNLNSRYTDSNHNNWQTLGYGESGTTHDININSDEYILTQFDYILEYQGNTASVSEVKLGGYLTLYDTSNTNQRSVFVGTTNFSLFSKGASLVDILNYLEEHPDSAGEQMEQDKQEQQQQGEQSQDNSNQSGSDVSQNTTSILNAITGFFSAFTSATPTNCNMDWGLSDYGFGVINMCQNPIPQEFQVILSIISLLIVVPMILWLFSSIINAFKEFQS